MHEYHAKGTIDPRATTTTRAATKGKAEKDWFVCESVHSDPMSK